jgi:hypothetical protein
LILDNVEDPADIEPLLGELGDGQVIVTSRRDTEWGRLADPVRLGVLAQYAPDAIPRVVLGGEAAREDTDEALGLLASYSMITLTTETVSFHRLLQAVILTRPDTTASDPGDLRETALGWLSAVIPDDVTTNLGC